MNGSQPYDDCSVSNFELIFVLIRTVLFSTPHNLSLHMKVNDRIQSYPVYIMNIFCFFAYLLYLQFLQFFVHRFEAVLVTSLDLKMKISILELRIDLTCFTVWYSLCLYDV